jgi:hypothetical protein
MSFALVVNQMAGVPVQKRRQLLPYDGFDLMKIVHIVSAHQFLRTILTQKSEVRLMTDAATLIGFSALIIVKSKCFIS